MQKLKLTSVRARLTLWNMGVLALALAGLAVVVHFTVKTILMVSVDHDLAREAGAMFPPRLPFPPDNVYLSRQPGQPMPDTVKLSPGAPHLPAFHVVMEGRKLPPNVTPRDHFMVVRLLDANGQDLPPPSNAAPFAFGTWNSHLAQAAGKETYTTLKADGQEWRVFVRHWTDDAKTAGVVQVGYPLSELNNLLGGLDRTLLILLPFALLVTGVGGAFLTSRALRPVRQIAQAAAAVEASDLSCRLPIAGKDEFAELAATFNGMFGRLEAAFLRMERSVEQQKRFTADASHELRTPLTTIKANADWALRRPRCAEEYREAFGAAMQATERMNRLIEDLLALARADADAQAVEKQPVSISQVLQAVVAGMERRSDFASIILTAADPALVALGDACRLERLFANLLENALRHTPADGEVRLTARLQDNSVRVTIEDTGEGIPAEHLPRICERFYRVDAARSRPGGAGLGLAICQSIVQAHAGEMEIASAPGKGTTVLVTLPRYCKNRV